jgi:Zn-finger nucleic acid-binding protein
VSDYNPPAVARIPGLRHGCGMRSPIYPDVEMVDKEIEPGLVVYQCPQSGGLWIRLGAFLDWKNAAGCTSHPLPRDYVPALADTSGQRALLCPESGGFMIRYPVGHDLPFHVDQSPVTGDMWLNQGEWEALKSKGLHRELNLVFTSQYQREIRAAEYAHTLERTFRERIGPVDYQKVADFKQWMDAHPNRYDICCYLTQAAEAEKQGE